MEKPKPKGEGKAGWVGLGELLGWQCSADGSVGGRVVSADALSEASFLFRTHGTIFLWQNPCPFCLYRLFFFVVAVVGWLCIMHLG